MRNYLLIALFAGVAGCAGGTAEVGVRYASPDLVYVDDGVQVVADYDYPVFYSDNAYWMYRGGYWYRSPYYDRGWVATYSYDVPYRIRTIDRPGRYAHYHRGYNDGGYRGTAIRDHRTYQYQPQQRERTYTAQPYRTQTQYRAQPQTRVNPQQEARTPGQLYQARQLPAARPPVRTAPQRPANARERRRVHR